MIQLTPVRGGYLVKSEGGWDLVVRPLWRQFRLAERRGLELGRYWCYPSFEAAVLAAVAWEVSAGTEPVGWSRRGGARP